MRVYVGVRPADSHLFYLGPGTPGEGLDCLSHLLVLLDVASDHVQRRLDPIWRISAVLANRA